MADRQCPGCGRSSRRGAAYCPHCGTSLTGGIAVDTGPWASSTTSEHDVALGAASIHRRRHAVIIGGLAAVLVVGGLFANAGGDPGRPGTGSHPLPATAPSTAPPRGPPRSSPTESSPTESSPTDNGPTDSSPTDSSPTDNGRPSTVPSASRPTATAPRPAAYRFEGAHLDLGGASLYATTSDGDLLTIAADGSITSRPLPLGTRGTGILARRRGVVFTDATNRYWADDAPDAVRVAEEQALVAAEPDELWVVDHGSDQPEAARIRLTDGATVDRTSLPPRSWVVGDDGTGALLVEAEGAGTYRLEPDGRAVLVTGGKVVAATAGAMVVYGCDERLACSFERLDPTTGAAQPVPLSADDTEGIALDVAGRRLASCSHHTVVVVDLTTAERRLVGTCDYGRDTALQWTPDGSRLVWISGGRLLVWVVGADTAGAAYVRNGDEIATLMASAVRP